MIYSSFFTIKEASRLLGISVAEVEELILKEKLELIIFNDGDVRILIGSVLKYKNEQDC